MSSPFLLTFLIQFTNLYKPSHIFTYNHVIDEILKKRLQKDLKITLKKS
ncbi:hypothetical protein EMIT0133MI5_30002 [Bacillus velezensis]